MPDWLFPWYHSAVYWSSAAFFWLGFSLRIEGQRHIPRQGPVLLVSNHESFLDPVLVGLAAPRPLCYLARKTLFEHRFFAWVIQSLKAVPIDQEGLGKEGLKAILEQLQKGRAVLVFPEGHRSRDGNMQELRPGIQLLIRRVQAPIIPVGIAGAYEAWPHRQALPMPAPFLLPARPGAIGVSIGRPLSAKRYADMPRDQLLRELHEEIRNVRDRANRLRRRS